MSTRRSPEERALPATPPRRQCVDDWRRAWRRLAALIVAAHCGLAGAAEAAAAETAELARIAGARAAVERDARVAQAACAERFAATSCIERVKAERRERLQQLSRERAAIDDARRKQRAAERAVGQGQREADRSEPAPGKAARLAKPPASASTPTPTRPHRVDTAQREAAAVQAEAAAARRAEESSRRAAQARAHREAVAQRNQLNAAAKATGKPLPVPPAASAVP